MSEKLIKLLIEYDPDITIKDYEKYSLRSIEMLEFELKQKKIKDKAAKIEYIFSKE